ncbi:hypothetical protein GCM10009605_61120 [Nocardiopsis composta]
MEIPAASAISSTLAEWYPLREKTRIAASIICCSRTSRGSRLCFVLTAPDPIDPAGGGGPRRRPPEGPPAAGRGRSWQARAGARTNALRIG